MWGFTWKVSWLRPWRMRRRRSGPWSGWVSAWPRRSGGMKQLRRRSDGWTAAGRGASSVPPDRGRRELATAAPEPPHRGATGQFFVPPPSEGWLDALAALPRWSVGGFPLEGWRIPPKPPPTPLLPGVRVRINRIQLEYRQNPLFLFRLLWRADLALEDRLVLMVDGDGQWVEPASLRPGLPSPAPGARGQVYGLQRLLQQALEAAPRWAKVRGQPFLEGVDRRRLEEERRLEAYYRGLEEEASEPLRSALAQLEGFWARRLLPGAPRRELPPALKGELDTLREELAQTRARLGRERRRRMAEVARRYGPRLEVELLGGALVWIPHLALQVTMRPEGSGGEHEPLELEAAWN